MLGLNSQGVTYGQRQTLNTIKKDVKPKIKELLEDFVKAYNAKSQTERINSVFSQSIDKDFTIVAIHGDKQGETVDWKEFLETIPENNTIELKDWDFEYKGEKREIWYFDARATFTVSYRSIGGDMKSTPAILFFSFRSIDILRPAKGLIVEEVRAQREGVNRINPGDKQLYFAAVGVGLSNIVFRDLIATNLGLVQPLKPFSRQGAHMQLNVGINNIRVLSGVRSNISITYLPKVGDEPNKWQAIDQSQNVLFPIDGEDVQLKTVHGFGIGVGLQIYMLRTIAYEKWKKDLSLDIYLLGGVNVNRYTIETENTDFMLNIRGTNPMFGGGLEYELGRLSKAFSLYADCRLFNVNNATTSLESQKYNIGLNLGFRYRFIGKLNK